MILGSGIVAGAVAALVLNACFNILGRKDGGAEAPGAEAAERPSGSTPKE